MASVSADNFTCGDAIEAMNNGMIPCVRMYNSNGDLYGMLQIMGMMQEGDEYIFLTGMGEIWFSSISTTFQEAMDNKFSGDNPGGVIK